VNDDSVANGAKQFLPAVNVDDDGGVQVTFLDTRDDLADALYSQQLATSTDGGTTFGPNVRVSDGTYPHGGYFLGDYLSATVSGGEVYPLWPDARLGDQDVFTHAVDLIEYDGDGILNDGDGSGQYADHRCMGGHASGCDDNCPGVANPAQADATVIVLETRAISVPPRRTRIRRTRTGTIWGSRATRTTTAMASRRGGQLPARGERRPGGPESRRDRRRLRSGSRAAEVIWDGRCLRGHARRRVSDPRAPLRSLIIRGVQLGSPRHADGP
jgi:hypothetical protein